MASCISTAHATARPIRTAADVAAPGEGDGLGGDGLVPLLEAPLRAGLDLLTAAGALNVLALGALGASGAGAATLGAAAGSTGRAGS